MTVAKSAVGRSVGRTHALHKGKTRGTSQTFEEDLSWPQIFNERTYAKTSKL